MDDDNLYSDEQQEADKISQYFQNKKVLKLLRKDLKELKENHPDYEELKKLNEKTKIIRTRIKDTEDIHILEDKVGALRERNNLIKEIIKEELLANEQEEVMVDDRKLKIVPILKEMKAESEASLD